MALGARRRCLSPSNLAVMTRATDQSKTALLVVDVQAGIMDGQTVYDKWPDVLERIGGLIQRAADAKAPV